MLAQVCSDVAAYVENIQTYFARHVRDTRCDMGANFPGYWYLLLYSLESDT